MYVPPRYRVADENAIDKFITDNGFATLVTAGPNGLMATHIPVEMSRRDTARVFTGHVSKANPQWRELEAARQALLIFLGPHTYVTPEWYDHPNVPTWNYQAVHVTGSVTLEQLPDALMPDLRALSSHYDPPFDVDAMPPELRQAEIKGIVGFELVATKVEAAFKLSQNRNAGDYANIIERLEERGDDASRAIARAMRENGRGT